MLDLSIAQLKRLRVLKSWYRGLAGRTMNLYGLFLAWPLLSIGNSLSFYIFLYLVLILNRMGDKPLFRMRQPGSVYLMVFMTTAVISTIFSPINQTIDAELAGLKLAFQAVYWALLVIFIQTHASKINFYTLCKYLTIGTWISTAQYFFFNFIGELPFLVSCSRNSIVFTILALLPFHVYYLQQRLGKLSLLWYLPLAITVMLLTEGRAGAILVLIECLLIASLMVNKRLKTLAKLTVGVLIILFIILFNSNTRLVFAQKLSGISPRVAEFVEGSGKAGNLQKDESWLTRRLMIEKGKEIIKEYPFMGVGLMNFSFYEAKLLIIWNKEYAPLQDEKDPLGHFNKTSSHNSYLQVWAETGYIGLTALLLLLVFPLWYFVRKMLFGSLELQDLPLISLFIICMHFYVIANITNAMSWFIFGFAYAAWKGKLNV